MRLPRFVSARANSHICVCVRAHRGGWQRRKTFPPGNFFFLDPTPPPHVRIHKHTREHASLALSFSLSHTHTHTHIHTRDTYAYTPTHPYVSPTMECSFPSDLPCVEGTPGYGGTRSAAGRSWDAFQKLAPAAAAAVGGAAGMASGAHSSVSITVGEAMDVVAVQCERRGLTSAATWLSEIGLHALPSLLSAPVQACSYDGGHAMQLDSSLFNDYFVSGAAPATPSLDASMQPRLQRLHRVALGYFTKGEYQRCHHLILREVMRNTTVHRGCDASLPSTAPGTMPTLTGELYANEGGISLPQPEVVRGFRTTTLPPLLQFLSLYALFMDGVKVKQLSNNAAQGGGTGSGGTGHGAPQRALHPHARVLRAYLLEAMHNPINTLSLPSFSSNDPEGRHCDGGEDGAAVHTAPGERLSDTQHTPSAKHSWTKSSTSWRASVASPATAASGAAPVGITGACSSRPATTKPARSMRDKAFPSTNASSVFSNLSPAGSSVAKGAVIDGTGDMTSAMDLLHVDPYLSWLMGVVLRELYMRQESATYLLAAVSVNPLLRCAWEDLTCLVAREAQLTELDAVLDGLEPSFMVDIFAAEVRCLLGVTPVSSARLRIAAAAVSTPSDGYPQSSAGSNPTAAPASTRTNAGATSLIPAATLSNAWECFSLLFPDTPFFLSQLARFYYHQRNRLDKAEALYQRIRSIDPHYLAILYDYSNVLYTKRDRLGLSSLAQSVYQADAFRAETNFAVGNYYVLLGQHDRAALHFHRATAIDPQCAEAWLLLGHAYVEVKNTTAAVEAYRTAVELNERDYRGWYNLGQIYELLEAYHHALYYYWHTTSLRPADPGMWVAVANCLEHDGRIAESIACLERAETYDSSSSPGYPAYVRRIATHHIANSSYTRACVYLEKLAQSPAASTEDLLLALPFIVQHYVQRARNSVEGFLCFPSCTPGLLSRDADDGSLATSPSSSADAAGRPTSRHARAAAALQHLNRAEEHLNTMAELVMPSGQHRLANENTNPIPETSGAAGEGGSSGAENSAPSRGKEDASSKEWARQSRGGPGTNASVSASSSAALAAVGATTPGRGVDIPPVAFVRCRYEEISMLRAQAVQLFQL
ncbi:hypothetical protein JKF63_07507 [Porcisia hertigi]|uniref:Cdc23 domain-containing protein n=1 Tax=Porcisia hertigi TaxID=2761500 RepID=A0A836I1W8_9TRYP|nr:hypothetical protein JKF63_07507 [Porcisia hertigi]